MAHRILFTKLIDQDWLMAQLGTNCECTIQPALSFAYTPPNKIRDGLPTHVHHFIVTSQNTVKAIEGIPLKGEFFVVGQKTAQALKSQGREVTIATDYARELAPLLTAYPAQSWTFLCGASRRDHLVDQLKTHQHQVTEVITYHSVPHAFVEENTHDSYVFFSPLSFQTFLIHNTIDPQAVIFSIGDTTTEEILKHYPHHQVHTAKTPLVEEVVNDIKKYLHVKK